MNILFICSGNSCRSPMAEYLFTKLVREAGRSNDIKVASAGVAAYDGERISRHAYEVLRQEGIDAGLFRSRRLTQKMIDWADLIIAMTSDHKLFLTEKFPEALIKCELLGDYSEGQFKDLTDPFGGDMSIYQECLDMMKKPLDNLLKTI